MITEDHTSTQVKEAFYFGASKINDYSMRWSLKLLSENFKFPYVKDLIQANEEEGR